MLACSAPQHVRSITHILPPIANTHAPLTQGIAIAILVYAGVLRRESWTTYDKMNVASGIQDFLICIEMFLAALAHAYAFPPRVGGVWGDVPNSSELRTLDWMSLAPDTRPPGCLGCGCREGGSGGWSCDAPALHTC